MARYLVVAHKTAESPELSEAVRLLAAADMSAEFALLVPATPNRALVSETREDLLVARARAATAAAKLRARGLNVTTAAAAEGDVVDAIRDCWTAAGPYARVVISTLPPGVSHWLRLDAVSRARRLLGRRVIHVVAHSAVSEEALVGVPRIA